MCGRFPGVRPTQLFSWGASIGAATASMARFGRADDAVVATDLLAARIEVVNAGRLRKLRVIRTATPGVGTTVTYTVRVNGVNTAITCTLVNGPTAAQDLVNSVAVVPGDLVEIIITITGAPGSSPTIASMVCES